MGISPEMPTEITNADNSAGPTLAYATPPAGRRHSRVGWGALAASLVGPAVFGYLMFLFLAGYRPPPRPWRIIPVTALWVGPFLGLALGVVALVQRNRRRWPAIVGLVLSESMLSLFAVAWYASTMR